MTVEVYELHLPDAPTEVWYGVRVDGRDLRAGWADPAVARRIGEEYEAEWSARRGGSVSTIETPKPEPEEPELPETEPEEEPKPEPEEGED